MTRGQSGTHGAAARSLPKDAMTRDQFVEKYRHEWGGMILDAATVGLHGEQLSVFIRQILRKVDTVLAKEYADLHPDPPLPINGAALRKETAK